MSEETNPGRLRLNREAEVINKPAEFQEAPGEEEAEAVRDTFLKGTGPTPSGVAAGLDNADAVTRSRALSRLQRERGNAYVQRVVAEARGTPGRLVGMSQSEMVDEVVSRKGSGSPLPETTKSNLEGFFGADLGGVRVHEGGEAASLNRELDAQAFTVGSDVFFAEGKYNPTTTEGQGLLAHELTHVGQQGGFGAPEVQRAEEDDEVPGGAPAGGAGAAPAPQEEETTG
jgi:hypothetical protein